MHYSITEYTKESAGIRSSCSSTYVVPANFVIILLRVLIFPATVVMLFERQRMVEFHTQVFKFFGMLNNFTIKGNIESIICKPVR